MTEQVEPMLKALVSGYSKKNGVTVRPHNRRVPPKKHPQKGEKGERVVIHEPSRESAEATWYNPNATATFVPDGNVPKEINGIAIHDWSDAPITTGGWNFVDGVNHDLDEPPFIVPSGKRRASGVIVQEKDGRVWMISPTNRFGGYNNTFPKGGAEEGLSDQANALKECFEESGLKVKITGFIGDFERTTSVGRMYLAERVGGDPTQCGWETQAVRLVPKGDLYNYLNMYPDWAIAEKIGAGPIPQNLSQYSEKTD